MCIVKVVFRVLKTKKTIKIMKTILILMLATSLFYVGCASEGSETSETEKPKLSEEVQTKLTDISKSYTDLVVLNEDWQNNFAEGKAAWETSRKMDSIEINVKNYAKQFPVLADAYETLLTKSIERGNYVDVFEAEFALEMEKLKTNQSDFETWKTKAEAGEVDEKEIEKGLAEYNQNVDASQVSLTDLQTKWVEFVEIDKEALKALQELK